MTARSLPRSPDGVALFLDVDGTLIDIAPRPDAVFVPPDLPATLERLTERLGGALALVSGRDLPTLDRLFAPARLTAGAVHGSEIRLPDGTVERVAIPATLPAIKERLLAFASTRPGILVEDKGFALALHYRLAPERADEVAEEMRDVYATLGEGLNLQPGKMVVEIRPRAADKGVALDRLMSEPAFAGRIPVAVGDDLTDEGMFRAAAARSGLVIAVGPGESRTSDRLLLPDPAEVRAWLEDLAG